MPTYLVLWFDEDRPALPSNCNWQYVEKKTWQALADSDVIKEIEHKDIKYLITQRRSYRLDDLSGSKMVLQMDVKKK